VLSAWIAIQVSIAFMSKAVATSPRAASAVPAGTPTMLKPTIIAPPPLSSSRREKFRSA